MHHVVPANASLSFLQHCERLQHFLPFEGRLGKPIRDYALSKHASAWSVPGTTAGSCSSLLNCCPGLDDRN